MTIWRELGRWLVEIDWMAVFMGGLITALVLFGEHYLFKQPWPVLRGHQVTVAGVLAVLLGFVVYNILSKTSVLPWWLPALYFVIGGAETLGMHWLDNRITEYERMKLQLETQQRYPKPESVVKSK